MSKNRSNSVGGFGNTKQTPKKNGKGQENGVKRWCFTLNNYTEKECEETNRYFRSQNLYIIGKEVGKEGTPHLQGYVEFTSRMRLTALKKIISRAHWEKAKGDIESNIKYCSKDGDFQHKGCEQYLPVRTISKEMFYKWQQKAYDIVTGPVDDRKVYWFWSEKGNRGKTSLAKYLSVHHGAIPVEGKKNDILFCAATFPSNIYIFDFERSMEEYVSYGGIEKIKNGYYMCAKYESKPIVRNPPHILCFANFLPNLDELSEDRWVIENVDEITDGDHHVPKQMGK